MAAFARGARARGQFVLGTLALFVACNREREPEGYQHHHAAPSASQRAAAGFLPTTAATATAPSAQPEGMVWVPGGEFSMGSADPAAAGICHEPMDDARPIHRVVVSGFFMDSTEVTNAAFARFVKATNYVTVAERKPTAQELPGVPLDKLAAGSSVFTPTEKAVPLDQPLKWWRFVAGADWRHPEGPGSSIKGRDDYPVVSVAYQDAIAYARWAGKDLPTEAEWEFAARGGQTGKLYPWGDELEPGGRFWANIYQGEFPVAGKDTGKDGFVGAAPVGSFAPNPYGLYDMAGNAWEWVRDWYRSDQYAREAKLGTVTNPQGPSESYDTHDPKTPQRVQRGGSFLCTDQYCTRYMVGTRGKGEPDSPTNHVGFRCVKRAPAAAPK